MATVKCRRRDCISWDGGLCSRDIITIDEDAGCLNFEEITDLLDDEDLVWGDDEGEEAEELDFYADAWEEESEDEEEASGFTLIEDEED